MLRQTSRSPTTLMAVRMSALEELVNHVENGCKCVHVHRRNLDGDESGDWRTTATKQSLPPLCELIAKTIAERLLPCPHNSEDRNDPETDLGHLTKYYDRYDGYEQGRIDQICAGYHVTNIKHK